jgi:hypothetical protein
MKKSIFITIIALVATAISFTSCNKIKSMDDVRGYEVSGNNRYEVVDMKDNRKPLDEAIDLRVPDTIGRQGTSGVVPGTLTADIAAGAGFVRDFEFTYNNGEKTFSYSVAGDFGLEYNGTTVWPLHGFTLTGVFSVVSERVAPTYLQVSKVEWTLRNAENGAIAAQKTSYHKIYEDPKDSVVIHDTVWSVIEREIHDTIWRTDTIWIVDTTVIRDTIVMGGDTTSQTRLLVTKHKSWDGVSGGYIWGTDSIIVTTLNENGNVVSRVGGTYQHKTPFTISGITGNTFNQEVVGNCYDLNNGHVTVSNNYITVNCGATQVVSPVILDGVNWTNYVHGCGVRGQKVCFGANGIATIHFVDIAGAAAGTTTTTYTLGTNPPTPGYDTINVPGTVLFAGVTLSLQDPVNGKVVPEYYLVIEYQKANGQIWRMRRPETSTGSFTNVQLHSSVTASTISSNLAAGMYPAYCYRYNNGSNTEGYVYHVTEGNAWATIWVAYDNSLNSGGMFTNANSTSNIFYGNGDPAIEKGYRTTNGTLTVNGNVYYIQGN